MFGSRRAIAPRLIANAIFAADSQLLWDVHAKEICGFSLRKSQDSRHVEQRDRLHLLLPANFEPRFDSRPNAENEQQVLLRVFPIHF